MQMGRATNSHNISYSRSLLLYLLFPSSWLIIRLTVSYALVPGSLFG